MTTQALASAGGGLVAVLAASGSRNGGRLARGLCNKNRYTRSEGVMVRGDKP